MSASSRQRCLRGASPAVSLALALAVAANAVPLVANAGLFEFVTKTPYRADTTGHRGGYDDTIAANGKTAEVAFRAYRNDSAAKLRDYAYLRAADLAIDRHFRSFTVVKSQGDHTAYIAYPPVSQTGAAGTTFSYADIATNVQDTTWTIDVAFTNRAAGGTTYDALGIDGYVRKKYGLKDSQR